MENKPKKTEGGYSEAALRRREARRRPLTADAPIIQKSLTNNKKTGGIGGIRT